MKIYPRRYEYVFSRKDKLFKNCNFDFISMFDGIPKDTATYINMMRSEIGKWQKDYFDFLVKMEWMVRRFCYHNSRKGGLSAKNGIQVDRAMALFMRAYVGYDHRFFYHSYIPTSKIVTYFSDFFPDFDINNPFDTKYEFPYKHVSLEHLFFVYQMPERLEILDYVEKNKLSYPEFFDFVVNYINCYNEEHGEHFIFIYTNRSMPYIKYVGPNKKYGIRPEYKSEPKRGKGKLRKKS